MNKKLKAELKKALKIRKAKAFDAALLRAYGPATRVGPPEKYRTTEAWGAALGEKE